MSAAWEHAFASEEQQSILGGEVTGEQGARQTGDTSTAADGLESGARVGTRVEGPSAGGGEGEAGAKHDGHEGHKGEKTALIHGLSSTVHGPFVIQ